MNLAPALLAAVTTLSGLKDCVRRHFLDGEAFNVTCTVVSAKSGPSAHGDIHTGYYVEDGTSTFPMTCTNGTPQVPAGTLAIMKGHVGFEAHGWHRAFVDGIEVLGRVRLPEPAALTAESLRDVRLDGHIARMSGILVQTYHDEIDPRYVYMIMRSEAGPFVVLVTSVTQRQLPTLRPGTEVEFRGIVVAAPNGSKRQYHTPFLKVLRPEDVRVASPPPADPFAAPDVDDLQYENAPTISCANRHAATGRVLTALGGGRILLRTDSGKLVTASLDGMSQPRSGTRAVVSGFPETDLFSIHLAQAEFKTLAEAQSADERPEDVVPSDILSGPYGTNQLLPEYYGRLIRIRGRIADIPGSDRPRQAHLVCDRHVVPVDTSAISPEPAALEPDSVVEVTGYCVLNTASWTPTDIHPRINGFTIVPRSADDIVVLSRPPWWTPRRRLFMILALLGALVAILAWNRALRKMIDRRSQQLYKAELAKAAADMRVDERTRIAAEIHDSVAQTLTGVGFQIDAAAKVLKTDANASERFLAVAKRTLLSCREELRRCLWDLRTNALEEADFSTAIVDTIRPCVGNTRLDVDFGIPRGQMSDTLAHAILSILRELAANAVRHGHATRIRITGEQRPGIVRFSVSDNGSGFDPATCPGPASGHFGLKGVHERVTKIGGRVSIDSVVGKGTNIEVEMRR